MLESVMSYILVICSDLEKKKKNNHVIAVYTVLIKMHPFLMPFMQRVEKGMTK